MFKSKTFFVLIISAVAIIISSMIVVSCTSSEDVAESNNSIGEEFTMGNDTIYVETEAPIIKKSTIGSVSDKTRDLVELQSISNSF